ncbi:MAG: DUF6348 family protein [Bryobacteraceae bacterium]
MEPSQVEAKLELARQILAKQLSETFREWSVQEGVVRGPGRLAVVVRDHHRCGESHLDIGFVVNREGTNPTVLWDCIAGFGAKEGDGLAHAAEIWSGATLPVCLEIFARDGTFADHYRGNDPRGCAGWHVIHGPWLMFGKGEASDRLQAWALDNPLLPSVGKLASRSFQRENLNCVKVLFGSGTEDIAEVRVNGERDEAASEYLRSLPWPRSAGAAFARCYLLFIHPE